MTADEWWGHSHPLQTISYVEEYDPSPRKHRLFVAACCKQPFKDVADFCERFADGSEPDSALSEINQSADRSMRSGGRVGRSYKPKRINQSALSQRLVWAATIDDALIAAQACIREIQDQKLSIPSPDLIREIFSGIFCEGTFDPRWRTPDTLALAQAICDDRAFERLPILADALMDAGCEDEQIIGHCHSEGPHVRGCWVVDLVLNKQ